MAIYSTSETEIYNTVKGILVVKKKVISTNVRVQIPFANSTINSKSNTIGYYNKRGLYVYNEQLKGNLITITNQETKQQKVIGFLSTDENNPFYLFWED